MQSKLIYWFQTIDLSSIEGIDRISDELEHLDLSDNCVTDIRPLCSVKTLIDINLAGNDM